VKAMKKANSKNVSLKELLEQKKIDLTKTENKIDWNERKEKWLSSINDLFNLVDSIIVKNLNDAGYEDIKTRTEEIKITEDYIGTYMTYNYFVETKPLRIVFYPIGSIIIGANGRVDMMIQSETIKLVLKDWVKWYIVKGFPSQIELVEFNEKNITEIFKNIL
jgi:hypothetical protein